MTIPISSKVREEVITTQTTGVVMKKSIVYDVTNHRKRLIELHTLISVKSFDFFTRKVIISCIKGTNVFDAEVSIKFLLKDCALNTPDANQKVTAIMAQHTVHNLLDKDTAIFIIIMMLTYVCGLILGGRIG